MVSLTSNNASRTIVVMVLSILAVIVSYVPIMSAGGDKWYDQLSKPVFAMPIGAISLAGTAYVVCLNVAIFFMNPGA